MSQALIERLAHQMVNEQLRARGITDGPVLQAMLRVPRHSFVPHLSVEEAYSDRALPTAQGQTISQPLIVAAMTQWLDVHSGQKVLEIGTGSGYQAAVLAELGAGVISLERRPVLAIQARKILTELGYGERVQVIVADGTLGWPPAAPYDRILITAAAPDLPQACKDQLADGGRLVIPQGDRQRQQLHIHDRKGESWTLTRDLFCVFVPLVGRQGWPENDE